MRRRRLVVLLGLALVAGFAGLLTLARDPYDLLARSRFDQIGSGMTRTEVWTLMRDIPEADSTMGNSLDSWDIGGRYTLLVEFGPDYDGEPGTVDQPDPEGENWTVKQVILLDLSKPTPLQQLLAWLGLWSRSPGLTKRCR